MVCCKLNYIDFKMGFLYLLGYVILVLLGLSFPKTRLIIQAKLAELYSAFSTLCITLVSLMPDKVFIDVYTWKDSTTFLILLSFTTYGISFFILDSKDKEFKKFKEVKKKLSVAEDSNLKLREQYYFLCSEYIRDVFGEFFELTGGEGNSRVSLYKHKGESFKLLGRHSDNPMFNKRKETSYPEGSGFISYGWQNGSFSIHNIPAWKRNGSEYKSFVRNKCDITEERLKALSMHSRSYYIFRFDNKEGDGKPFGIIVFERISENEIPVDFINNIIGKHKKQIANLLKSMNALYKIDDSDFW